MSKAHSTMSFVVTFGSGNWPGGVKRIIVDIGPAPRLDIRTARIEHNKNAPQGRSLVMPIAIPPRKGLKAKALSERRPDLTAVEISRNSPAPSAATSKK